MPQLLAAVAETAFWGLVLVTANHYRRRPRLAPPLTVADNRLAYHAPFSDN